MTTTNVSVGFEWTKIAQDTDEKLLVTWDSPASIEVATTSADSAPVVRGHRLARENAVTRNALGTGFVWAKTVKGTGSEATLLVIDK